MSIDESDIEERFFGIVFCHYASVLKRRYPKKHKNGHPVKTLKFSKQIESLIAFDRAILATSSNRMEIRDLIIKEGYKAFDKKFYLYAYFLQYKAPILGKSPDITSDLIDHVYSDILNERYLKYKLKTEPSKNSSLSQHEILTRICKNMKRVKAFYALPVIFPDDEAWDLNPKLSLDNLLLIPPSECSITILPKTDHHIVFDPLKPNHYYWCSEPQKHATPSVAEILKNDEKLIGRFDSIEDFLLELIEAVFTEIPGNSAEEKINYFLSKGYLDDVMPFTYFALAPNYDE